MSKNPVPQELFFPRNTSPPLTVIYWSALSINFKLVPVAWEMPNMMLGINTSGIIHISHLFINFNHLINLHQTEVHMNAVGSHVWYRPTPRTSTYKTPGLGNGPIGLKSIFHEKILPRYAWWIFKTHFEYKVCWICDTYTIRWLGLFWVKYKFAGGWFMAGLSFHFGHMIRLSESCPNTAMEVFHAKNFITGQWAWRVQLMKVHHGLILAQKLAKKIPKNVPSMDKTRQLRILAD